MAITIFNRFEKKYLLTNEEYKEILHEINKYLVPDEHTKEDGYYTISNVYYDTVDDYLINHSLSKPEFKEKLRLRSYGIPKIDEPVFLEIKKKYKKQGNKRRICIPLQEAYDLLENPASRRNDSKDIIYNEICFFLKRYELRPKVYIAYDRMAYVHDEVRITFDHNIRTRRHDIRLEDGDHGDLLLGKDQTLMEIKVAGAYPLWLANLLTKNEIYPVSFSKYGHEYTQTCKKIALAKNKERKEVAQCLNPYLQQQPVLPSI